MLSIASSSLNPEERESNPLHEQRLFIYRHSFARRVSLLPLLSIRKACRLRLGDAVAFCLSYHQGRKRSRSRVGNYPIFQKEDFACLILISRVPSSGLTGA